MKNNQFHLDKYLNELRYLVNQDSGSDHPEGVEKIALYFKEKYLQLGWSAELRYISNNVGPLLEIKNRDSDNYDVLILGHMDTVFPKGTAVERPFSIEGNKAYGPGVIDMKASLLSIYYAMEELNKYSIDMPSICILQNSDEEISSKFSSAVIEELAKKSKYSLVLEPARNNGGLVYERKGLKKYLIEFLGLATHAGLNHEEGISAINELSYWITELHKLTDYNAGTTVNVGLVSGGTKANVVASYAKAEVDVRFKTISEIERVESKLNLLLKTPVTEGIKVNINRIGYRPPMNPSNEMKRIYEIINRIGVNLGIDIKWVSTGGGSDANFTAALGIPTIDGLGPVGGGAHGVSEYIEIDTIEPRLKLLIELVKALSMNG